MYESRLIVGDIPRVNAARLPGGLAFVDGERRVNWQEFDARVARLANGLGDQLGVQEQERVAILAGNCLEYADLVFASSRIKAIYSGLNTRHHPREMAAQLADCAPRVLVVGGGFEEIGPRLAAEAGCTLVGLAGTGIGVDYDELTQASSARSIPPHGDVDAPYVLTYTSGTTGQPKGAMISSRNEIAFALSLIVASETRIDDRFLVMMPMFHKGGQFAVMQPAYLGLPTVLLPGPDPETVCRAVEAERVSAFVAVPTVMAMLADHLESVGPASYDLSSLRHVLYGSNPIPLRLLRRVAELVDCSLCQIGGIGTEGGIGLSLSRADHEQALADPGVEHRLLSCGRVQPGIELRIVDDSDRDVAVNQIGEMVFRGDAYVDGYWGRPQDSAQAWRGGWFHSGDLGRRDEDGYVYYVDRKSGRIKTGGETVFAREVEAVLETCPAVRAACVVGVPDDKWGEAIWAVVEPAGDRDDLERVVRDHVRAHLAGFKVPRHVLTMDVLPRTALGKIAIAEVRAFAQAQLVATSAGAPV